MSADPLTVGFHISSLYSPLGWFSWTEAAVGYEKAKDNPADLKPWTNTVLAECWNDDGEAPDWEALYNRREDYDLGTVPDDDGLRALLRAWVLDPLGLPVVEDLPASIEVSRRPGWQGFMTRPPVAPRGSAKCRHGWPGGARATARSRTSLGRAFTSAQARSSRKRCSSSSLSLGTQRTVTAESNTLRSRRGGTQ